MQIKAEQFKEQQMNRDGNCEAEPRYPRFSILFELSEKIEGFLINKKSSSETGTLLPRNYPIKFQDIHSLIELLKLLTQYFKTLSKYFYFFKPFALKKKDIVGEKEIVEVAQPEERKGAFDKYAMLSPWMRIKIVGQDSLRTKHVLQISDWLTTKKLTEKQQKDNIDSRRRILRNVCALVLTRLLSLTLHVTKVIYGEYDEEEIDFRLTNSCECPQKLSETYSIQQPLIIIPQPLDEFEKDEIVKKLYLYLCQLAGYTGKVPLLSKNIHIIINKQLSKSFKRIIFKERIEIGVDDTAESSQMRGIEQIISKQHIEKSLNLLVTEDCLKNAYGFADFNRAYTSKGFEGLITEVIQLWVIIRRNVIQIFKESPLLKNENMHQMNINCTVVALLIIQDLFISPFEAYCLSQKNELSLHSVGAKDTLKFQEFSYYLLKIMPFINKNCRLLNQGQQEEKEQNLKKHIYSELPEGKEKDVLLNELVQVFEDKTLTAYREQRKAVNPYFGKLSKSVEQFNTIYNNKLNHCVFMANKINNSVNTIAAVFSLNYDPIKHVSEMVFDDQEPPQGENIINESMSMMDQEQRNEFEKHIEEWLTADKMRNMVFKFEGQVEAVEQEQDFLLLTSKQSINYTDLATYMKQVIIAYRKTLQEKNILELESAQPDYTEHIQILGRMTQKQLISRLSSFYCKCLNLIRVYNFNIDLVFQFKEFYQYIYIEKQDYVSGQKHLFMQSSFDIAYQKLKNKQLNDPNLQQNQQFLDNLKHFEKLKADIKSISDKIQEDQRKRRFMKVEDDKRVKQWIESIESTENPVEVKKLKSIINVVRNNFIFQFGKEHLTHLCAEVQKELRIFLKLPEDKYSSARTYGLTGCGIHFVNSTIKLQFRLEDPAARFQRLKEHFEKLFKERDEEIQRYMDDQEQILKKEEFKKLRPPAIDIYLHPTCRTFVVKHVKEQHIYLQLVNNDKDDSYNQLIFKVKFQFSNCRRECLVAQLINNYLNVDKNKFYTIAVFWIFFLKINGLVGKKRGYLSSTAYLLMLINYLQQQCQLPNFQDRNLAKPKLEENAQMFKERLTTAERLRFGQMLKEENLQKIEKYKAEGRIDEALIFCMRTETIDCFICTDKVQRVKILEMLGKQREMIGKRYKVTNESLILRFFRFLVTKLPNRSVAFDVKKGSIKYYRVNPEKKLRGPLIKVKDPFLKFENHGYPILNPLNLERLIILHKTFIMKACFGQLEDFIQNSSYQDEALDLVDRPSPLADEESE